ncbi:MAG: M23 family metallopeptidase [Winogradskyella sp.]|uniref:M23 family metallopeptidase n=1 Tax=Winogradskyella sp. TaxID=1883156 RepID=UPI0017CA3DEF|nr:M23 family metallopeptidase [Winogradskyella sp.]MBT8244206.1 M23 family metallopeptidase [Winogradskyella sp.]NNK21698.1 M23 family metallopeptidase [Winogradskyella sp.]
MIYYKDNTFSQYVHLKQYGSLVKIGDSIKANQYIALSGFTGWTTIPHLHFGVYKPTENGLESIPILLDSIRAKELKRGNIITKKLGYIL